tara:strand:+ start:362 stop:742 length:381 start_codon:yes stop_codon:yes gene_type:complete
MKIHFPRKQAGMGAAGWMLMLAVFGSVLTVGLKLVPLYLDHNTMSKILDGLAEEEGVSQKRDGTISKMIQKRFKLNNIRDFKVRDNVEVKRSRDGVDIIMDYEVRLKFAGNVDLIASFDKSVKLKN